MAGGGLPQADDDVRERAETYLRLLAESELRRALASPPIRRIGLGSASLPLRAAYQVLPPAAALAARALRPLDPVVGRVLATRERVQGRALPVAGPVTRSAIGAASGLAASVSASFGAVQSAGWQVRRALGNRPAAERSRGPGPAREGLSRVGRLASGFAAAELVDLPAAEAIVAGLEAALAARSRLEPGWAGLAIRRRIVQQRAALPGGQIRAIPLGQPLTAPSEDGPIQVMLLALVLAADRAEVTVTGRMPAVPDGKARQRNRHRMTGPLAGSATDDLGGNYHAHFVGGWDAARIDGALSFHPLPPPGARWLDVKFGDSDAVRVQAAGSQSVTAELGGQSGSPVERFIDSRAERFLSHHWPHGADYAATGCGDAITALRQVGALSPASPALQRLAALLRRLGSDLPEIQDVPSSDLPDAWASVLDSQDAIDGPTGVSPLAVVFPEIDGTRCVLTGLRSEPDSAWLQLVGWGWPGPGWPGGPGEATRPSVWARDDAGRWHIAADRRGGFGGGHANVTLRLTPPVHPEATSLEITLIGKTGLATATVPLTWQDPP